MEKRVVDLDEFFSHERFGAETLDDPDTAQCLVEYGKAFAKPDGGIFGLAFEGAADPADEKACQGQENQEKERKPRAEPDHIGQVPNDGKRVFDETFEGADDRGFDLVDIVGHARDEIAFPAFRKVADRK